MSADPHILVVDDDLGTRSTIRILLEQDGCSVKDYESANSCLSDDISLAHCLICDIRMPKMNGLELLAALASRGNILPVIFITGHADVQLAVRAMKSGAVDFIEKPFEAKSFLASVQCVLAQSQIHLKGMVGARIAKERLTHLTNRERQVLGQLVAGRPHKVAARELGISHRTVEVHRARIMEKLGARGLSDLVRFALAASSDVQPLSPTEAMHVARL